MGRKETCFAVFILLGMHLFTGCGPRESSAKAPPVLPGMTEAGKVLLPNQWSLNPVGWQMVIGDLPLNMKFSPDGDYLAITHCGFGPNEIIIVKIPPQEEEKKESIVSRVELRNLWYGLIFGPKGEKLYISGGRDDTIYEFDFKDGYLFNRREIDIFEKGKEILPAGMDITSDGKILYTANCRNHSIGIIDLSAKTPRMKFIALPEGSYPYTCLLSPDEKTLYASLWGKAQVVEIDLASLAAKRFISTDEHPNEMLMTKDGERIFVTNANENTVSVIDTARGKIMETISSALYPNAPEGSTPNSLALSDDEFLFIANADNNNLAVFEIGPGRSSRNSGFIPVGWYPTSVRIHPKTKKIYVANGKGQSSKPNRYGPRPGLSSALTPEYIAGLFTGTLSIMEWPDAAKLGEYTQIAYDCSPYIEGKGVTDLPDEPNPIPMRLGDPSPIKYCVYIVKENRTYDQILGDIEKGNGDPDLCLFPEKVTPNHHSIVNEFVLLDNFYVESEVSADGHEWTMGAYATDFIEKIWPGQYGHKGRWSFGYVGEGAFDIARPTAGYIWDKCAEAGVSYRSYGEFIENGETPNDPGSTTVKSLEGHFDPYFRSFDMKYSDVDRAKRFIEELERFEKQGEMPQFIVMRLPNDHTAGSQPGSLTPTAYIAQNDLSLGMVVEALSRSRFWPEMAIFVVEDDAQNGPDHVDAHRTVAMVISPYAKRGIVDSSFYSTASMLRTMELILGLQPMSQFDAAARPMFASFTMKPNIAPYKCKPAQVDLNRKNPDHAWGARLSLAMNLEVEDAADDILLNEIIWKSVRGAHSEMPAPVRAAFVFPHNDKEKD